MRTLHLGLRVADTLNLGDEIGERQAVGPAAR